MTTHQPAGPPAAFFKGKAVEAEDRNRRQRRPFVCGGCGEELVLVASGHQFCANRWCKEPSDVKPDWWMKALIERL